jgi:hypothetical protein
VIVDTLHTTVLKKMDSWLKDCGAKHAQCSHLKSRITALPTRLLDLSSLPSRQDIIRAQIDWLSLFGNGICRLVENAPGSTGDFVALSYCWGKTLAYTTTTKNLRSHTDKGILLRELPKTLQDAMMLARCLGFTYIWADCLCIVQDDKGDWEREAAQMANVYTNACLTIAATRASHCGEGFLQPRRVKTRRSVHFEDEAGSFDLYFHYDDRTLSPGSMESVTPQPLRVQRVSITATVVEAKTFCTD